MAVDTTGFYVKEVKTILVGAHPDLVALIGTQTCDAVFAYHVAVAQTVAHIVEITLSLRLHEYALLEHTHPDVSLIVFYDAGYLALGQVHQSAEERVILQESGLRVIYIDAQSVAADIELVIAADIDVFDGQVSDAADSGSLCWQIKQCCRN